MLNFLAFYKKRIIVAMSIRFCVVGSFVAYHLITTPNTLTSALSDHGVGMAAKESFALAPTVAFAQNDNGYEIVDDSNTDLQITYANYYSYFILSFFGCS
ncbi:MAG: hypothetical protein WC819_06390 [Parcubacteria group bacterium]